MGDIRSRTTMFCGIIAFAIGLSVLLRGRKQVHWLFAAFASCLSFWYLSQSLEGLEHSSIWKRITGIWTVLLPQFAVRLFQAVVPDIHTSKKDKSKLPRVAMVLSPLFMVLVASPYYKSAWALIVFCMYIFGLLAAALAIMWQRGKQNASKAVRDRVRFLAIVGALATVFTLTDFLFSLNVYLPPFGAVLALIFLYVLAESLYRPRLADVYELVGKLSVSTLHAFILAAIFYIAVMYLGRFGAMYLNAVLASIIFLVLSDPIRIEIEERVKSFLLRERFDLETSVAILRRKLAYSIEMEKVIPTLLDGLMESRRITSAAIYLRDADGFECAGSNGVEAPPRLEALALRPILDKLERPSRNSLMLEEFKKKLVDSPIQTAISTLGIHQSSVLLGIYSDDELAGLLFVGDERVQDAYTPEEVTLFEGLAAQLGVAVANSRVYMRLKERDRLAALGAMAAGLAHEIKNPLGAIKGAAQLLEEMEKKDENSAEFLSVILEETDRLNRVVGGFLDYVGPRRENLVPTDINGVIRRTTQILSVNLNQALHLMLELEDNLPMASIDAEQLRQVLINLIQNAKQAMDDRGKITVSSRRSHLDKYVEINVRDEGPGIDPKTKDKLFVPFFTTKKTGTGLGLAISQRIVQNAGGRIDVLSHEGLGTTFTISLPSASDRPSENFIGTKIHFV